MPLWKKTDSDAAIPKYLTEEMKARAIFIDDVEAKDPDTIAKGITGPGWWLYHEYKDSAGNIRHKAEHLITMKSSPVNAGDRQKIDATIEVPTTYILSFTTKPTNKSVVAPADVSLTSGVSISTGGGSISCQWEKLNSSTKNYEALSNALIYSGVDTDTLVISNSTGLNGATYRVIVSATNAVSITSVAVKLTVS